MKTYLRSVDGAGIVKRRRNILALEAHLMSLPPHECPVTHHFTDGVYVRQMFIAAGVALCGHIHRFPCLNIIAYGDIIVATDEGRKRITGPTMFASPAGVKRAGWAQADTLWTTIHANADNEHDVERLEARLIEPFTQEWLTAPYLALETT